MKKFKITMDSNKIKFIKVKKCDGNRFLSNLKNISKGKNILNKNFKTIYLEMNSSRKFLLK